MMKKENNMEKGKEKQPIRITSPLMPSLDEFIPLLEDIWQRKWITNNGHYHEELERALASYLKVPYISLFTNGTLPLITALQALHIKGEVITTPYSFVATTHALWWNGIKPVFVDIDPQTCNLDVHKIEAAITPQTTAILPVHIYGTPCSTKEIQQIADKYKLKVIYDAAHAFGVEKDGCSILKSGDISTLSFHATKVFNTIEGGALISPDKRTKRHIDYLKNFGFTGETTVVAPGINSKMDEVRAAYGLLNLKQVDKAIESRKRITLLYREGLKEIDGISFLKEMPDTRSNYAYFPIFVDGKKYGLTRDKLYFKLRENGVWGRRYFYPLISEFPMYKELESASRANLPNAYKISSKVICLPIYYGLSETEVEKIIELIKSFSK